MVVNLVCLFVRLLKNIILKTTIFSNSQKFSAKGFCDNFLIGSFSDTILVEKFINSSDFFTIETENIPLKVLKLIEKKKNISILKYCRNCTK